MTQMSLPLFTKKKKDCIWYLNGMCMWKRKERANTKDLLVECKDDEWCAHQEDKIPYPRKENEDD